MGRQITHVEGVPSPVGAYPLAVIQGNLIYTSGQIGLNENSELVEGGVEGQTVQTLSNLQKVLEAGDSSFDRVICANVFITNSTHFPAFNKAYADNFTTETRPARTTVVAGIPVPGAYVEINMVAARRNKAHRAARWLLGRTLGRRSSR